jgi:hypothetical protein
MDRSELTATDFILCRDGVDSDGSLQPVAIRCETHLILNPAVESVPAQARSLSASDPTAAQFTILIEKTWLA